MKGYANKESTLHYPQTTPWFHVSRIAIGTHLGEMDTTDSSLYQESIAFALCNGINFIDTALNYRGMRSERDVGAVLCKLIQHEKKLKREEIVVSTKAGIIPGDIDLQLRPENYLKDKLLHTGILQEHDLQIVGHHKHVLKPSYYEFAIQQSLNHLQLDTIDIHYLHNPEISMQVLGEETFYQALEALFCFYEEQVEQGAIRFYGLAVWSAFTENPHVRGYISLERVIETARKVAGPSHHCRFIQTPFHYKNQIALTDKNQRVNDKWRTLFEAAEELEIYVTTSAPFDCGRLQNEKQWTADQLFTFVLNTPRILSTMIGMKRVETVKKNLSVMKLLKQAHKS
ncbi:aldo/keto reductase [Fictibacillus nanhaiensis]|uniref:aldo/keto reductase n=1 Tax=Fictibacillus nanhaiensis TaxID=742169 RepID=UPI001C976FC1|nr:aldo/keto reductase [Fictibacillus nanhaiensis]MBY6037486.1 aldo/keto reductase [Fictibacillus nanhaiensis]